MAIRSKWTFENCLEAFSHIPEIFRLKQLILVKFDQCDGHSEQNLGTLVEQAVPYPQNRLIKTKENVNVTSSVRDRGRGLPQLARLPHKGK
jgi:hypothetical protein